MHEPIANAKIAERHNRNRSGVQLQTPEPFKSTDQHFYQETSCLSSCLILDVLILGLLVFPRSFLLTLPPSSFTSTWDRGISQTIASFFPCFHVAPLPTMAEVTDNKMALETEKEESSFEGGQNNESQSVDIPRHTSFVNFVVCCHILLLYD